MRQAWIRETEQKMPTTFLVQEDVGIISRVMRQLLEECHLQQTKANDIRRDQLAGSCSKCAVSLMQYIVIL